MILEALRSACERRGVPDLDRAIDAYVAAGTLNAGDRAVLDDLVKLGDRGGKVLAYLRGRYGRGPGMRVAYVALVDGIGGGPVPRG
jgi:hypothetical protein